MEIYKIENLTFKYPASEEYALRGVDLTVKKGEFLTVCGQSGCGKSTLLRLMKSTVSPNGETGGSILFDGENLTSLDLRTQSEKIGFVMQSPDNQIVTDKVWHELAFGLESLGKENREIRVRVAEMAAFFGIEGWFHKKTSELSGGQKQLLNLASVMVMQPSVLILDEPTSQLDPIAAQEFLDAVAKINRELGVTVVLSEHRLEEALSLSDTVAVMDKGDIIFCGKPYSAASALKEKNHPMLEAMSAAMRVFAKTEGKGESPVTVREGRQWLSKYASQRKLYTICKNEAKIQKGEVALTLEDVYFRYEKDTPDVIKALNAKIYRGELYAVLGGNGSGKTTMLSLISGINKPQRGSIRLFDENARIGVLPQNPQTLFIEKTVEADLWEILSGAKLSKEEKARLIRESIKLCDLTELTGRHPYDLSGGEAQRAALAKILLQRPDILLLDEPTKGMDAQFKKKLAAILSSLQKSGVTIIMVSHDVEFCAEYAQRCAMFFDGSIVSESEPRTFFSDKSFYTTAANRMSRGIVENAVTTQDIIYALSGENTENEAMAYQSELYREDAPEEKKNRQPLHKLIPGIALAILSVVCAFYFKDRFTGWRMYVIQLLIFVGLGFAINLIIPQKEPPEKHLQNPPAEKKRLKKHTVLSAISVLVAVPLTILAGCYLLDDRKYYFISLMIIFEIMVPFFLSFEKSKVTAREIVVISVLCAIAVAGRSAFFMLPQFKPMLALIIISAVTLGAETGFLVGALSAFVSNIFFGQGPWTPWQMFAYGIVGFLAGILIRMGVLKKNRISLCIYGMISVVVLCGGILDVGSLIMYMPNPTKDALISSILLGLPLNIIHGASTVFFIYTCAPTMIEKIERLKHKFGIFTNKT